MFLWAIVGIFPYKAAWSHFLISRAKNPASCHKKVVYILRLCFILHVRARVDAWQWKCTLEI